MSNRTAKFASAIFVGLLAGVSHTTLANGAVRTPNDCLSGPKGQTPPGGHWYYHIDRTTKRHCWYLAEEAGRLSRITPQSQARLTRPVSPQQPAVALSFADARAELPLLQPQIEAPNRNDAWIPAKPSDTTVAESSRISQVQDANTPQSVVASRWPEQFGTTAALNPISTKADPATSVEPASRPLSSPSPRATDQIATAEPPSQPPIYFAQLQLAALLGGLALAGIAGAAVFKSGSSHGSRPRKAQTRPGTIWEPTDDDSLSAHPRAYIPTRRSNFARDLDQARRNDRIAEFYSQLSKDAAT